MNNRSPLARYDNSTFCRAPAILLALATGLLAACSGGGGGSGAPNTGGSGGSPPNSLSYPTAPAFVVNQPIAPLTPSVSGTVTSYVVSPALPAGLALSSVSGVISGTPTAVSPPASYTVTASNADGQTAVSVSIVVNDVAPSISYASSYYSFTNGVAARTITPSHSGGAVVSWSVKPALPPGLTLGSSDGTISGTPTAGAAPAPYVISASNSGGQSTANLTLAVSAGPALDLGHTGSITLLRLTGSQLLSQDGAGHWVLWDRTTAQMIASETATVNASGQPYPADLAGPTLAIGTSAGIELRSSSSGQLLAAVAPAPSWWTLATDGTYVCAGSTAGLTVWSRTGQVLLTRPGDYSKAMGFADPGAIAVALGPAGANAIETISLPSGSSSVGPAFLAQFTSWFADGARFLTYDQPTNTVRIYSSAGVLEDTKPLLPSDGVGSPDRRIHLGIGNWFWTYVGSSLNIYAVGASAMPTASYPLPAGVTAVGQSGPTVGVLAPTSVSVIDLSGAAPVKVDYPALPLDWPMAYAATASSSWFVGTRTGLILDGSSLSGTPRYFGYGAVRSVAGGTGHFAIAAERSVLYFNSATNALEGVIDFRSSKVAVSSDGSVLALNVDGSATINVYSLPSGNQLASIPYRTGTTGLCDWSLTPPGTVIGEAFFGTQQAIPSTGGPPLWTGGLPLAPTDSCSGAISLLSPDGTLSAFSPEVPFPCTIGGQETNIYHDGNLVTSRTGETLGWIDNGRLLVAYWNHCTYVASTIYDPTGMPVATPPIPYLGPFQIVTPQATKPDLLYSPSLNAIVSLGSGATTWTSASPTNKWPPIAGAVAGGQVVFVYGQLVLAEPH
jgi:hypothetical protein